MHGQASARVELGFGNSKSKGGTSIRQWADKAGFAHSLLMKFPLHQRPNASRLEPFRAEIVAMRSSNWPFQRIADWMRATHRVEVTKEAVRQFCKVRHIGCDSDIQPHVPVRSNGHRPKKTPVKFEYDDSVPILIRKNSSD